MTSARTTDYRLQRLDASQLILPNAWDIPVRLFAGEGVPIERAAVSELLALLALQDTITALAEQAPELFDHPDPGIVAVALSSDFHKGSGIPIGTTLRTRGVLIPQAVGTDVNCGMRVHLTGWALEQVQPTLDQAGAPPAPPVLSGRAPHRPDLRSAGGPAARRRPRPAGE